MVKLRMTRYVNESQCKSDEVVEFFTSFLLLFFFIIVNCAFVNSGEESRGISSNSRIVYFVDVLSIKLYFTNGKILFVIKITCIRDIIRMLI